VKWWFSSEGYELSFKCHSAYRCHKQTSTVCDTRISACWPTKHAHVPPNKWKTYYYTKLSDEIFAILGCYEMKIDIYRRFGITHRSHLQGQTNWFFNLWTLKIDQMGFPETSVRISLNCITSQKNKCIIETAAEAWNNASCQLLISQRVSAWWMK
jgi:hypothetical protein